MGKYNAWDNIGAAALLYWQLILERDDLKASIAYNEATDQHHAPDGPDYELLQSITNLLAALNDYVGADDLQKYLPSSVQH